MLKENMVKLWKLGLNDLIHRFVIAAVRGQIRRVFYLLFSQIFVF